MKKWFSVKTIKYLACSYFVLTGLAILVLGNLTTTEYIKRDLVILLVFSLPMIIDKRIFHLAYGVLAAMITLTMLFVYAFGNNPWQIDITFAMFFFGLVIFSLAFASSLALIYVGTHSNQKNTFRLI